MNAFFKSIFASSLLFASTAFSVQLVSDAAIATQKKSTEVFELKNKIPVIFRTIENSDILQVDVTFRWGIKDQKQSEKMLPSILFGAMTNAAQGWPKDKLFAILEKYSASILCSPGIESSTCSLSTVNDYWPQLKPVFAAIINNPALNQEDIDLTIDRNAAAIRSQMEQPESYANEVVNRVYYGSDHPYFIGAEESLKQLKSIKRQDLINLKNKVLNAKNVQVTVVGSLPKKQLEADLNSAFSSLPAQDFKRVDLQHPKFDQKAAFVLENKKIPTAYIRIKLDAPGMTEADSIPTRFLYGILSEELGDEIRTKRSLSYATYAYTINYELGVGVIAATTSKPKETLETMQQVIHKLKTTTLDKEDLQNFKTEYATNYFLTLEEHSSLAGAIGKTFFYLGKTDSFYDMPRDLEKITGEQIKELANKYLVNMRIGVVYDKEKFNKEWAEGFIKANLKGGSS